MSSADNEAAQSQAVFRSDVETRLRRFAWWKGNIVRDQANALLNSQVEGSYLMRYSSAPCRLALSIKLKDRVANYAILWRVSDGYFALEEMLDTWVQSIPELLHAVDESGRIPGGSRLTGLPKRVASIDNTYAPGPLPRDRAPPKPAKGNKKSPAGVLAAKARLSSNLTELSPGSRASTGSIGIGVGTSDSLSSASSAAAHPAPIAETPPSRPLPTSTAASSPPSAKRRGLCGNQQCDTPLEYVATASASIVKCPRCGKSSKFPALTLAEQAALRPPATAPSSKIPPFGFNGQTPLPTVVGSSTPQSKPVVVGSNVRLTYGTAPTAPGAGAAVRHTYQEGPTLHTYQPVPDAKK